MTGSVIKTKGMKHGRRTLCAMTLAVFFCVTLIGCMSGVSNDPAENDVPWLEDIDLPGWEKEIWDIPCVTEVYPLNIHSLIQPQAAALEIRLTSSHMDFDLVKYTFYRGCIMVTDVDLPRTAGGKEYIQEYFIGPYNDLYLCYSREYYMGDEQGPFILMREFATLSQVEEYLTYCTDGTFPSFASLVGVHREASPEGRFEYDWKNPQTEEIEQIKFDMYVLTLEDGREILMFANTETNILERIVFPEETTGEDLPADWRNWSNKQLFEQMLVANRVYTSHIRQIPEEYQKTWDDLVAGLSTVPLTGGKN
jgi:hypothetical protein